MMTARKTSILAAGILVAAFAFASAGLAQAVAGSWTLRPADLPDRVQLSFVYGHNSNSSDDWRPAALKGLDLTPSPRHDVHFTIERDAGRIEAEGSASAGTAAGSFQFSPNPAYEAELRKLGLGEMKTDNQLAFALHDVSLSFAHDLMALKVGGLTADKLLAMRIHGLEPAYVKDLRAAGAKAADADQLIAFRIHDVTPDFVAAVEKLGYAHPSPEQLIAMKIHDVTPDYISSVKSKGVKDVSLDQLVAMKIHGVD